MFSNYFIKSLWQPVLSPCFIARCCWLVIDPRTNIRGKCFSVLFYGHMASPDLICVLAHMAPPLLFSPLCYEAFATSSLLVMNDPPLPLLPIFPKCRECNIKTSLFGPKEGNHTFSITLVTKRFPEKKQWFKEFKSAGSIRRHSRHKREGKSPAFCFASRLLWVINMNMLPYLSNPCPPF